MISPQTAVYLVSVGLIGLLWLFLMRRPVRPKTPPTAFERQRVRQLIADHGDNPFDEFALAADKHYFFATTDLSVVVFALWQNYAITMSDPIGPADEHSRTVEEFIEHCEKQGWEPVFYAIRAAQMTEYEALGFKVRKIGEQARIPLLNYTLKGAKFQNLRTACNRATREGITFRWYPGDGPVDKAIEASLKKASDGWLHAKCSREMAFDLGHFDLEEIRLHGAAVAMNSEGRVEAFATWVPYNKGRGLCIDLMRHCSTIPGLMDFVIIESIKTFQARGLEEVCLANAQLANTNAPVNYHERAMRYIYQNLNHPYCFKSLFVYKNKFQPEWHGSYLAYRTTASLPLIGYALVSIHVPGGLSSGATHK